MKLVRAGRLIWLEAPSAMISVLPYKLELTAMEASFGNEREPPPVAEICDDPEAFIMVNSGTLSTAFAPVAVKLGVVALARAVKLSLPPV